MDKLSDAQELTVPPLPEFVHDHQLLVAADDDGRMVSVYVVLGHGSKYLQAARFDLISGPTLLVSFRYFSQRPDTKTALFVFRKEQRPHVSPRGPVPAK